MTTGKKTFVRAEEGPNNSVIYYDEDGNKLIRYWKKRDDDPVEQASTRSWRNNNPGNLVNGDFSKRNGSIGFAGGVPGTKSKFAVFPDYATGRKAQARRLKEGDLYIDSTLNNFVRKYIGMKPGAPDTQEVIDYRKAIRFFTKFDMERTIRSLNDVEYEQLLDAMKKHEGWREGREEYVEVMKILGIHYNRKRVISEFLVGDVVTNAWISKSEAITLAEEERLHAVVVHAKHGTYLRPEYHHTPFRQMVCVIEGEGISLITV